jgi:6-phosphogluconolactonase (cycloisomerase 2 family)
MRRRPSADRNVAVANQALSRNSTFLLGCFCVALLFAAFVAQPLQATVIPRYAYVVDPGAGQILEYSMNPSTGALAPIAACPGAADPNGPSAAIVDKTGSFLYVANAAANDIWVYAINPATGCLVTSPAPASYPTKGTGPVAMDIAAHDGILFVSDSGSGQIDAFTMTNGVLAPIVGSPFTGCTNAAGIAVDLIESYVYLASNVSSNGSDSGTGIVCAFEYSLGGKEWMSGPTSYATTGAYPTRVAYDSVGQFLFVTNSGANTVESFNVSTTGVLTANNTIATGASPAGVAVNPFGQQVFVANGGASTISSFQIELPPAYGSLTANGAVVKTGSEPAGLTVDPSGQFLFVADKAGFINGYTINASTGKLLAIKGSPWATTGTGTSPVAIAIQP